MKKSLADEILDMIDPFEAILFRLRPEKLEGLKEIAFFLGWDINRLQSRLNDLLKAGVVFAETMPDSSESIYRSTPSRILRYCVQCARDRKQL